MFDFLRNLTKSEEEKRQEVFSAYLDETLSASQRREFEALLAEDADLRAEMELAQQLRQQMAEMPRRSLPRSFTLDASQYRAPRKEPLVQAYPLLRVATAMTAVFFVLALGLSLFTMQGGGDVASVAQTAMEPAPAFEAPLAEAELMTEATAEILPTEKVAEDAFITETEIVVEEVVEEAAAEALSLAAQGEMVEEATDADSPREFPAGAASGAAITTTMTTPRPTATTSTLPRLAATTTAVPRVSEVTTLADAATRVAAEETAVAAYPSSQEQLPSTRSLTTTQVLLTGLGLLLLLLLVLTLLTRRKI